eukprot:3393351-Prymnesium_polylepis.1
MVSAARKVCVPCFRRSFMRQLSSGSRTSVELGSIAILPFSSSRDKLPLPRGNVVAQLGEKCEAWCVGSMLTGMSRNYAGDVTVIESNRVWQAI